MKVVKSKRNENTVNLEVEASHDELSAKFDGAFKKVRKKASLPGFRKGKIPRKIFEKNFGKEVIIQEAIYDVVNDTYKSAIDELKLKVVDYPKNVDVDDYKEDKPIRFRCDVDVEPELKLKKYKGLKVTVDTKTADQAAVDAEIDTLVGMHATYEKIDGEAKNDTIVRFNATATIDGVPLDTWTRDNQATRIGTHNYGEEFDNALLGLTAGDKKNVTVSYPADYKNESVQGKTVVFDIDVSEIRERKLPELTDELVQKIDKTCLTVSEWKQKLETELNARYESENNQAKEQAIFDALIQENPLSIPDAMVEQEINMSLMQFEYTLRQQGMDMKQYMSITNKTESDMRDDVKEGSQKKVHLRKIIEAIIEKESISVTDDDINAEIISWKDEKITNLDDLKASPNNQLYSLKNNLLDKKVREFLVQSAKIK
ncbi:MAG: trigger factor [Candidatus Marinamargulisbacteria bacterium]